MQQITAAADAHIKGRFNKEIGAYKKKVISLEKSMLNHDVNPEVAFKRMKRLTDSLIMSGERITSSYDKAKKKEFKKWFREQLKDHIYKGGLIRRGFEKPRGYAGDYLTIESAYDNVPWSKLGIGFFWDKYMLTDAYIESVRRRKDTIKRILRGFLESSRGEKRILNMGSGSGRELRELFTEGVQYKDKVTFNLLDQDKDSLDFIDAEMSCTVKYPTVHCHFIKENILLFVRKIDKYIKELGKQDLVYSIGVADYLPDILCDAMFKQCYKILKKGASFYIAFKLVKKYKSYGSDWCCDWNFYERSEKDIERLIKESLPTKSYKMKKWYADERIVFYEIKKK